MVKEDVAGAVIFEIRNLQAVGMSDLVGLEGGVDAVHLDHRFGLLGLQGANNTKSWEFMCMSFVSPARQKKKLLLGENG